MASPKATTDRQVSTLFAAREKGVRGRSDAYMSTTLNEQELKTLRPMLNKNLGAPGATRQWIIEQNDDGTLDATLFDNKRMQGVTRRTLSNQPSSVLERTAEARPPYGLGLDGEAAASPSRPDLPLSSRRTLDRPDELPDLPVDLAGLAPRPTQAAPQLPLTQDRTRLPAATGGVGKPLPRDTRGGPNMMTPVGPVSREARRPKETFGTEVSAAKPPLTKRQEGKRIAMGFGQGEDLSLMQSGDPSQLKGSADITGAAQRAGLTGAKGKDERMYGAGDKYGGGQARFNVEEKQMREQIDTLFQKAQGGDRAARQELSKIHADLTSQADRAEGGPRIRPGQRQLETTVGGAGAQKLPQVIVNRILKDYSQQFRNVRAERTQGRRAAR